MDNNFEHILNKAITRCYPKYSSEDNFFDSIYPFSNENLNGYFPYFNLAHKTLLTVGSSSDHAINAHLQHAKVQTVLDICPYTKFYFYLKKSAILTLSYQEFLTFFCYYDYPQNFQKNQNVFNQLSYHKIRPILQQLDYESFVFWDTLFHMYHPIQIREYLFSSDEEKIKVLKSCNFYIQNETNYLLTQRQILGLIPSFINDDIFKANLNNIYDNIFLSNIGQYYDQEKVLLLLEKLEKNLSPSGQILICYLFNTEEFTPYKSDWQPIFNLAKNREVLNQYLTFFHSFQGVRGILFDTDSQKDSIMVYKKTLPSLKCSL